MSIKEENLIQYNGTLKVGQRLTKIGNTFMPVGVGGVLPGTSGTGDTSAFEAAALAIIGDESTIPDIPVPETPSGSSMKFYKCASVNIPQVSTGTSKPAYTISNASLSEEINGLYTYLGEFNEPGHSSPCLLWKNAKDNGYYIYSGAEGWLITTAAAFDADGFTPNVPPIYVIAQNVNGTDILGYSDEYAGKGTFAIYHALSGVPDGTTMIYVIETEEPEASKTWTGYELILTNGVYVVSDTETTGLVYGTGFTPVVGTIYDENALFVISTLFTPADYLDGCVFSANMQSTAAMYNGETVNLDNITLADAPGYSDGTKAMVPVRGEDLNYPVDGATDFANEEITITLSAYWVIGATSSGAPYYMDFSCSKYCYLYQNVSGADGYQTLFTAHIGSEFVRATIETSGWHHFVITYSNGTAKWYLNGSLLQSWSTSFTPSSISAIATNFKSAINAYMKDLQVYNRVLDEAEIADLYSKAKLPVTA